MLILKNPETSVRRCKPQDIKVNHRQREETNYGDLSSLAESIKKFGIIQPIHVDPQNNLIWGGRRLAASILAGVEELPVMVRFDVNSPLALKELELEENLYRHNLTPQEELNAQEELCRLREVQAHARGEVYTDKSTADDLGKAKSTLSQDRAIFAAMMEKPELREMESKKAIWSRYRQIKIQEILAEKARRAGERVKSAIVLGQCPSALVGIADGSVDLVVCDPPFGVNLRTSAMANWSQTMDATGYEDNPQDIEEMIVGTATELSRIMADGAHIYMFCAVMQFHYIVETFAKLGFTMDPCALIWVKPTAVQMNAYEQWVHRTEHIAWGFKGQRRHPLSEQAPDAIFTYNIPQGKYHVAQKPVDMLERIIKLSSVEGQLVLDCFCGSGSTLVAAVNTRRRFAGVDMNPNCVDISTARVQGAIKLLAERDAESSAAEPIEEVTDNEPTESISA